MSAILLPAMEEAVRAAADVGADAFVVEARWIDERHESAGSVRPMEFVRGQAIRFAPRTVRNVGNNSK